MKFEGIDSHLDNRGRLLGLLNEEGFLQGIGILEEFNESDGEIKIYTPVRNLNEISRIEAGSIIISKSGKVLNSDFYL